MRATIYKFLYVTLWHMSIGDGIIGPVSLQEIDNTPYAQASAQGHKEVVGRGGVHDQEEHRRFSVPDLVQLQLVIVHDLPELEGQVE